jgi:hypothetical protein
MSGGELEAIRMLFAKAEAEIEPSHKFALFQEALDLIDDLEPSTDQATLLVANNLRRANLHRLFLQLGSMRQIEIGDWFNFVRIFMFRQKEVANELMSSEPSLRTSYQRFLDLWWNELVAAVAKQGHGR